MRSRLLTVALCSLAATSCFVERAPMGGTESMTLPSCQEDSHCLPGTRCLPLPKIAYAKRATKICDTDTNGNGKADVLDYGFVRCNHATGPCYHVKYRSFADYPCQNSCTDGMQCEKVPLNDPRGKKLAASKLCSAGKLGQLCLRDPPAASGMTCRLSKPGVEKTGCCSEGVCGLAGRCIADNIGAPCKVIYSDVHGTYTSGCSAANTCYMGKCVAGCKTTADCPAGKRCATAQVDGICVTGEVGSACRLSSDCNSGLTCVVISRKAPRSLHWADYGGPGVETACSDGKTGSPCTQAKYTLASDKIYLGTCTLPDVCIGTPTVSPPWSHGKGAMHQLGKCGPRGVEGGPCAVIYSFDKAMWTGHLECSKDMQCVLDGKCWSGDQALSIAKAQKKGENGSVYCTGTCTTGKVGDPCLRPAVDMNTVTPLGCDPQWTCWEGGCSDGGKGAPCGAIIDCAKGLQCLGGKCG